MIPALRVLLASWICLQCPAGSFCPLASNPVGDGLLMYCSRKERDLFVMIVGL